MQSIAAADAAWPRMMWLNADRVLYIGLLGQIGQRCGGALALYLSLRGTHRIRLDDGSRAGEWQTSAFSVIPPYMPHCVASDERMICTVLIEPETIQTCALPPYLFAQPGGAAVPSPEALQRMHAVLQALRETGYCQYADTAAFDAAFFGHALPAPRHDARVQAVLEHIKATPNSHMTAQTCADAACLSLSRFLHLFKDEVGSSFRRFRAWRRARSLLYYVTHTSSLTDVALDSGYPDSSYFSHSIRRFYGLTPKSIFSGSRNLALRANTTPHADSVEMRLRPYAQARCV